MSPFHRAKSVHSTRLERGWSPNQSTIADQWRYWTVTYPYMASQVRPYVLSTPKEQALKPGNSFKECARDCPEMVVIPAGSFTMGGPSAMARSGV